MKRIFALLFICGLLFSNAFSKTIVDNKDIQTAKVIKSNSNEIHLEFNLPNLDVDLAPSPRFGSGSIYTIKGVPKDMLEPGKPNVPIIEKLVKVPGKGSLSIEILKDDAKVVNEVTVLPYQLPPSSGGDIAPYAIDTEIYDKANKYPSQCVQIKSVEVVGDFRFARVQFFPVSYTSQINEVTITEKVSFKIVVTNSRGRNELKRTNKTLNKTFLPFYEDALNIDLDNVRSSAREAVPDYLFIGSTATLEQVEDLINWKIRKGLNVTVANTSDIGNSVTQVDSYIEDYYNNDATGDLFVLLVGDENVIASNPMRCQYSGVNCPSDNKYGVIGSGYTPSIYVGRITDGQNGIAAYKYQAWKIVEYESNPEVGPWMAKSMTWGCSSPNGQPTASYWKSQLQNAGLSCDMQLEATGAKKGSSLVSTFNSGLSTFAMKGHGNDQSWHSAQIGIGSYGFAPVSSMDVGGRMCWVNNIACLNSRFQYSSYVCFAEQMMATGSIGNAQGCIGMYSYTVSSSGGSPTSGSDGMLSALYDGLFNRDMKHVGVAAGYGTQSSGTASDKQSSMVWGCPEMDLFFQYPLDELNVENENPVPGSFDVSTGVEGALVSVVTTSYKPLASGYTDASGNITLDLPDFDEMVYLTVTARNCEPFLETYDVTATHGSIDSKSKFKVKNISSVNKSGSLNIEYSLPGKSKVKFSVLSLSGKELYREVTSQSNAGDYKLSTDLKNPLGQGLYIVNLETNYGRISKTVSVLR